MHEKSKIVKTVKKHGEPRALLGENKSETTDRKELDNDEDSQAEESAAAAEEEYENGYDPRDKV